MQTLGARTALFTVDTVVSAAPLWLVPLLLAVRWEGIIYILLTFLNVSLTFEKVFTSWPCLAASRNADVVPAGLGIKSLIHPLTHGQFVSQVDRAETKFEKGVSDRNLPPVSSFCLSTRVVVFLIRVIVHVPHC